MSELFEIPEEYYSEEYGRESLLEELGRQMKSVKKKAFVDYKGFRRNSDIPYDYLREELKGLEYVESIGFVSGFYEVKKYGRVRYRLNPDGLEELKQALPDPYLKKWFDKVSFDKQDESWDYIVSGSGEDDDVEYRTAVWTSYCHQRTEWDDSYYGFFALPMSDGRFWLLYYRC